MSVETKSDLSEISRKLRAPFPLDWVKWRPQGKVNYQGNFRMVCYIDARCVIDRFDEVLGMGNWRSKTRMEGKGWVATIAIRVVRDDGSSDWIEHEDGSDETDIEAYKGGISDALKRAAVRFGVFVYGYDAPVYYAPANKGKDGKDYAPSDWRPDPKTLPREFVPAQAQAPQRPAQQAPPPERKSEPAPAQRPANARPGDPQPVAQVAESMGVLSVEALASLRKMESALRQIPVEKAVLERVFMRMVDSKKKGIQGKRYLELAERAILPNDEREKSGGWNYIRWVCDRPDLRTWNGDSWNVKGIDEGHQWRDWTSNNPLYTNCRIIDDWAAKVRERFASYDAAAADPMMETNP